MRPNLVLPVDYDDGAPCRLWCIAAHVKTKKTVLVELYDHRNDPLETANVADNEPEMVERLLEQLTRGVTTLP